MAKDPAFLFYPADASEDTQFLNRLERGCYFDLLKAQKKYRKFSLDLIRKVLGQDFLQCWPAIESVLKKDGELYFIEWADNAIENRAEHSAKQKKRIQEYWEKKKQSEVIPDTNHGTTTEQPKQNRGNSLEDENEIVNENEIKNIIEPEIILLNVPRETEALPREMIWSDEKYREGLFKLARSYSVPDVTNLLDRWEGWYVNKFDWKKKSLQEMRLSFESWIKDPKSRMNGKAKHDRTQQTLNDIAGLEYHISSGGDAGN